MFALRYGCMTELIEKMNLFWPDLNDVICPALAEP